MQRIEPGPHQESVWDYPRPPRVEPVLALIEIIFGGQTLAQTSRAWRVLETSHPPVYYIPPDDINAEMLRVTAKHSFCEWKGTASYYDIMSGERTESDAAWFYPEPTGAFAAIANYVAFYPSAHGRLFCGWRARAIAGGRFLWRLDYLENRRAVQRWSRELGLVSPRAPQSQPFPGPSFRRRRAGAQTAAFGSARQHLH